MSAPAATNKVQPTPYSHAIQLGGTSVNGGISVSSAEPWRREAIQKVIEFGGLPEDWDGRGSAAPGMGARQTAIEFLFRVPSVGAPRIVPVSGGGFHFEWSVGNRELEISIEPDCSIEALRVEHGMPIEDDAAMDLPRLFGWLVSQ